MRGFQLWKKVKQGREIGSGLQFKKGGQEEHHQQVTFAVWK